MNPITTKKITIHDVLQRLQQVSTRGSDWTACCPAHHDRNPSLSVGLGKDGRILLHCHAGCSTKAVVQAIGLELADLMPAESERLNGDAQHYAGPKRKHSARTYPNIEAAISAASRKLGQHVHTWTYHDSDGRDVFYVTRFIDDEGNKQFRPMHPVTGGIAFGDPPGDDLLPLYRLPHLSGPTRVYVHEGEKAADAAVKIGLSSTTSAHGSKSASRSDWSVLAGRDVVILADNDASGARYAQAVANILHRLGCAVRIVHLPGLPERGDVVEFIEDRRMDAKNDDAICAEIEALAELAPEFAPAADEPATDSDGGSARPVLVRLAEVQPEPVRWLWPGRIALGKLTMVAGDPGLGKSFMTLDIAARVSTGTPWPDLRHEPNPAGDVVLLSAEDDIADTIRPRLDAVKADVRRVYALRAVRRREGTDRMFNLATDLEALDRAITSCIGCRLVVVDPITAYLGKTDSHKNADIRGLLAPLAELAARHGVAIVAVSHLNKSGSGPAMYRTMGSLAFVAAARAAWVVSKDCDDPTRRLVVPVKNNLAADTGGLAYTLHDSGTGVPSVVWDDAPINITADDALAGDTTDRSAGRLEEAIAWLREVLADGAVSSKTLQKRAADDGLSWRTVERACAQLKIVKGPGGFGAPWQWSLPVAGTQSPPQPPESACPSTLADTGDDGGIWNNVPQNAPNRGVES